MISQRNRKKNQCFVNEMIENQLFFNDWYFILFKNKIKITYINVFFSYFQIVSGIVSVVVGVCDKDEDDSELVDGVVGRMGERGVLEVGIDRLF